MILRSATLEDSSALARIYNHYIENTVITFEEEVIGLEEMKSRLKEVSANKLPWFVSENDGELSGFAYANKWKGRCAYRYSVECSIYLDPNSVGQGLGTKLYEALFEDLRGRNIHALIGGIALPNQASVALHEKFGFEKVAHFKEVGRKFDAWIDVGYWQLLLPV